MPTSLFVSLTKDEAQLILDALRFFALEQVFPPADRRPVVNLTDSLCERLIKLYHIEETE